MALLYFADEALFGKLTACGEGSFLELARRYAHDTTLKPHLRQALQQHVDMASSHRIAVESRLMCMLQRSSKGRPSTVLL